MAKVQIFGVGFDDLDPVRAVRRVMTGDGEAKAVFTPNALILDRCLGERAYVDLLNSASLVLPDGAGVVLAAKRQGTPLASGRTAGIDFGEELLRSAAKSGKRVFLLGGRDGVAQSAAERLCERIPGLCVCGCYWGYFQRYGEENRQVREWITRSRAQILLVCLGFPIQEEWIRDNLPFLPTVEVAAGLGGSLDVWSGKSRRAPELLRNAGLEWAWRTVREPSRMRQIPSLIHFASRVRKIKPGIMQTAQKPEEKSLSRHGKLQK